MKNVALDEEGDRLHTPVRNFRQGDRFIGNRNNTDIHTSHFNMFNDLSGSSLKRTKSSRSDCAEEEEDEEAAEQEYARFLSKALFGEHKSKGIENEKILSLITPTTPTRIVPLSEKLRDACVQKIASLSPKKRMMDKKEERTIDIAGFEDEFYINVLDWSTSNIIAIALQDTLYLLKIKENGDIVMLIDDDDHNRSLLTLPDDLIVTSVSFSPTMPQYLAVGGEGSILQIWDIDLGRQVRRLQRRDYVQGTVERFSCLAWNGPILSSGSSKGIITNWDVRLRDPYISTFISHTDEVCGLSWNHDNSQLASGGADNLLNIWSLSAVNASPTPAPTFTLREHTSTVKAIAWCPWQSNLLATGGGCTDKSIKTWNTFTGTLLDSLYTAGQVCSLVWSPIKKELISSHGNQYNKIIVWKYPQMKKLVQLNSHTERVLSLALSPDGTTLISASADETLKVWSLHPPTQREYNDILLATPSTNTPRRGGGGGRTGVFSPFFR